MNDPWMHLPKPLAAAAGSALIVAFAFGGLVAAHNLPATPASSHASPTAQTQAAGANSEAVEVHSDKTTETDTPDTTAGSQPANHGAMVSKVAQDATLVGGPHANHGWYVSCVAHGGTPDVTANPNTCTPPAAAGTTSTTKSNGKSGTHGAPPHSAAPVSPVTP